MREPRMPGEKGKKKKFKPFSLSKEERKNLAFVTESKYSNFKFKRKNAKKKD